LPILEPGSWPYHYNCRTIVLREHGVSQWEIEKVRYEISYSEESEVAKVKHWNISMGYEKLRELFPDLVFRRHRRR